MEARERRDHDVAATVASPRPSDVTRLEPPRRLYRARRENKIDDRMSEAW